MIEFSELAQALAIEALDCNTKGMLLLLTEMAKDDDIPGAALIIDACTRHVRLTTLIGEAKLNLDDPVISKTLEWLKAVLITNGNAAMTNLVEESSLAAKEWIDSYLSRTGLDDIIEPVEKANEL